MGIDNPEGLVALLGASIFIGGALTLGMVAAEHYIPRTRLWFDRKILKRDSEIIIDGCAYGFAETYVRGSKRRKVDPSYDGIRTR